MSNFTFEDDAFNFAYGTKLPRVVRCKIDGYWPNGMITIYSPSRFSESKEYHINYSSGGRDTNSIKSDIAAIENFSKALTHAIQRAKELTAEYRKQTE